MRRAPISACLGVLGLLSAPTLVHAQYTVTPGLRVERSLNVPCALEFDLTNKVPTDPAVEEHLAWAVSEGGDWSGGNAPVGTYTAAYRDYKLKVYSEVAFAGERRIGVVWDPSQVYTVRAEINLDGAVYSVSRGGTLLETISVSAAAPPRVTMGYGWPPSVRSGATGATLSNIRWEEAATVAPAPGIEAEADTFTEAEAPGASHGGEGSVQTGGNGRVIFLRFTVSGEDLPISRATLRFEAVNAGGGGEIHFVPSNSWSESGLTHASSPCLSPTVSDSLGRVEAGGRYAFDVTDAVSSNGVYSFAIRSADPDGSAYHSRESGGGARPVLEIVRGARPALSPPAGCTAVTTPADAGAAVVVDAGAPVGPDAGAGVRDLGTGTAPDAGDDAGPDARRRASTSLSDGGCGCTVRAAKSTSSASFWSLGFFAMLAWRARRRAVARA